MQKDKLLAAVLSFFLPGLGQIYCGKIKRGLGWLAGFAVGSFAFVIPGVVVWIFSVRDAYRLAEKMRTTA